MNRSDILEKLKDIFRTALPDKADVMDRIDEDSDLRTQVGLNSIGMICMVIMIEETFSIQFGDVGFNDFETVRDVVDYIGKRSQE
ncbi:MAG: acyl carrier protein [Spirochaetales bacterium]|nr:acyl carrier protein [Spirochaetales bacterium]